MKKMLCNTYFLVFSIMVFVAALTWIVPSGQYDRVEADGRTYAVAGSYHSVDKAPQGIGDILSAPVEGFTQCAEIIAFILVVGALFTIIERTGAINTMIKKVSFFFANKPRYKKFFIPVCMFLFSLCGAMFGMEEETLIFIPIFIPLMAVLCPLIGGIPYMLYVTKAKKFGMTAIMGFLIGLIMVFFGNGYLTMVTGLVGGLLADVILKKADYKSAKSTVLSCGVFSIWVFGNFAPIFLNRESYMVMLTEGYGAEYAATLNTYMPMWIAPILLVACFVFGIVGGLIGKAICKKHFQRAGIA